VSTLIDVRVPADDFGLGETMAAIPGATFELTPVVMPTDPIGRSMLLVDGAGDRVGELLGDDPSVVEARPVAGDGCDGSLFNVEWRQRPRMVASVIGEAGGTILSAVAAGGEWRLRIHFDDRESVSTAFDFFGRETLAYDLDRIDRPRVAADAFQYGLSDRQRETLVAGFDRGLFSVPRKTDLSTLAGDMDVTHQALSERLRRAHGTLVGNTLVNPTRPVLRTRREAPSPVGPAVEP